MIKIENVEVVGWEYAIRGMRNPLNSWDKSDSEYHVDCNICNNPHYDCDNCPMVAFDDKTLIGSHDLELMKKLVKAGTDHRKFMRMITVYVDVTAPMYWWAEYDTYKVGTVRNSCSKMHTITNKEFELDDFSHEQLEPTVIDGASHSGCKSTLKCVIDILNGMRTQYLITKNKYYWWQIIQLLPSSYNQKSTLMLNYEVLANIYHSRKVHKLDEWVEFCSWIETLPYAKELICNE